MCTSYNTASYTTQDSISSNDSEISSTSSSNTVQYGPITVRVCQKVAPRLGTGRRSKYLVLFGEEAIKREKRREKNRQAAKRLKEKRQLIENELNSKLKDLENQHSDLQNYLQQLKQQKQNLQTEVNNLVIDPINELVANYNQYMPLFFEQYSNDFNLPDESLDQILNYNSNIHFY